MLARKIQASAVSMAVLKSLASRRFRLSQASVRSTTHRRGRSWKPFTPAGRLTISSDQRPIRFSAPSSLGLSLPFIPSIAETLEFYITTGYPFRHA